MGQDCLLQHPKFQQRKQKRKKTTTHILSNILVLVSPFEVTIVQIVIVQIDHVRSFWNPHLETRFFDIWSPMPFKSELISSCCKEAHDAILYHDFFIVVIAHVANTHVVVQSNHHVCKPRMLCLGELIMEWQATQ